MAPASALLAAAAWTLIPGSFPAGNGPDGNSILIDAPQGLVLVDTGRHPAHQDEIIAAAKARGRPIAAIVNTHWHLDHTGGNAEVRAAYPGVPIIGSSAVEGALKGFFPRSRTGAEAYLASGKAPPEQVTEIRRDMAAMDDLANLRPSLVVRGSGPMTIAGRRFDVHLEPYAATAGDVWLYDRAERLAIIGDLVVTFAPFMDTACPEGWRKALGNIAKLPFRTLVPGHGAPMDRAAFTRWRAAFDRLLDCTAGSSAKEVCVEGWLRDAAEFVPQDDRKRVRGMIAYYIDTRLRGAPDEKARYCPGGSG
ncbi:MBL fold metallo-hydrolase [Sphingomonas sp. ID1715]|uniref:MBL fold metallo-hydrolase n=1 Tax=Sphingomonas sp. ID1715 TaxID=1656898 RepID=UPI001489D965|nr:MBL fold metallo-hydrolase [Sphingomonas sp. ID1715]NNM77346.1 MBL fold metallo-hydrolase [Sphingomonas sp. ID1715]